MKTIFLILIYAISISVLAYSNKLMNDNVKEMRKAVSIQDTTIMLLRSEIVQHKDLEAALNEAIKTERELAWIIYRRGWWKSAAYVSTQYIMNSYPPGSKDIETQIKKDSIAIKNLLK